MVQDNELLRAYWREGSEPAFSELVRRYVGLVFSTARRQVRDAALAEDVAQTVFCLLARKARSLSGTPTLAGWLYRATCFCATRAARREGRRRKWEQEAMATNPPGVQTDEMWERLAPVLDEALATLGDKDRLTILLRFFQRKPIREVGAALGVSEAAAKMRVARSVERLRQFFARRGVTCSASGLALLLAERSIEAAPGHLAHNLSRAALSGTCGVSGLSFMQTLRLLARLNLSTLIPGGGAAVLCAIIGWHVFYGPAQLPSNGALAEQSARSGGTIPADGFQSRQSYPAVKREDRDLAEAIDYLRAALHSTDDKAVPGVAVVEAVYRFGSRLDAAFPILAEEAGAHDQSRSATDPDELAPRRAVAAMGLLGKSVPEAAGWLWGLYEREPDAASDSLAFLALKSLEQIGFQPQDISRLAQEVLARSQPWSVESPGQSQPTNAAQAGDFKGTAFVKAEAAGWVAKLIQADPAGSAAFLAEVQSLLADPDSEVRFWAACALLQSEGAQNPVVVDEVSMGLKNGSPSRIAWASKLLEGLGEAAVPIVPALLEAAETSTGNTRDWAFLSAGKIQSGLRAEVPEIDQSLAKDEAEQALCDELNSQHHTAKDLSAMLQDPGRAAVAARLLAEQFPLAKITSPALFAAVPLQQDEQSRNALLTSIRKLDPTAALAPEDVTSIVKSLSNLGSASEEARALGELLDKNHRLDMSWSTRPGFQTFAANLALENPIAYKAFVSAILDRAPSWKGLLPATSGRESR